MPQRKAASGCPRFSAFLLVALISGMVYAILFALAYLVEPQQRDATIRIPVRADQSAAAMRMTPCAICPPPMWKPFWK